VNDVSVIDLTTKQVVKKIAVGQRHGEWRWSTVDERWRCGCDVRGATCEVRVRRTRCECGGRRRVRRAGCDGGATCECDVRRANASSAHEIDVELGPKSIVRSLSAAANLSNVGEGSSPLASETVRPLTMTFTGLAKSN